MLIWRGYLEFPEASPAPSAEVAAPRTGAIGEPAAKINWKSRTAVLTGKPASPSEFRVSVGATPIRVFGVEALSGSEIAEIASNSKSPIAFKDALLKAHHQKGLPLVEAEFRIEKTGGIAIQVRYPRLTEIRGDPTITKYFHRLTKISPLTIEDVERSQLWAQEAAIRSGRSYTPKIGYSEQGEAYLLLVAEKAREKLRGRLTLQDTGSQYEGRYFAGINASYTTDSALTMRLDLFEGLDDPSEKVGQLKENNFSAARVKLELPTKPGVWSGEAHQARYSAKYEREEYVPPHCDTLLGPCYAGRNQTLVESVESEITGLSISGAHPLYIMPHANIYVSESLSYARISAHDSYLHREIVDATRTTAKVSLRGEREWSNGVKVTGKATLSVGLSYDETYSDGPGEAIVYPMSEMPSGSSPDDYPGSHTLIPSFGIEKSIGNMALIGATFKMQLANEPLPVQKKMAIGGAGELASYQPGVLYGDTGLQAYYFARVKKNTKQFTLVAEPFIGYGETRHITPESPFDKKQDITDIGISLSLHWRKFSTKLTAAKPISTHVHNPSRAESLEKNFSWVVWARF